MMKRLFILLFVFLFAFTTQAQYFYLKSGVRYQNPLTYQLAPQYFDAAIIVSTGTGNYYTHIITYNAKFSLAKGLSYGANVGYMFSDHIGLEVGLQYFQELQKLKSEDIAPHYPIGSTSWQFRSFNATPSLVITHSAGSFTISAKAGFLAGLTSLGKSIFFDQKRKTYKFNTSLSSGYSVGAELGFRINRTFSIIAEAGIDNQFYKPRKALIQYDNFTYYKIDELPVYLKEIIYVSEIDNEEVYYDSQSDTYFTSYYKPLMRLKESLKLNSYYIGIGLKYQFNHNEKD